MVRGDLVTGGVFSGTLDVDVAAGGGGGAAASFTPMSPNGSSMLRFATTRNGSIRVRVFDVRGRLVRTIAGADRPAGEQVIRFDGLGNSGTPLPAGIYLFRIETPDGELTGKASILR